MTRVNPNSVGVVFAVTSGVMHTVLALLVATGAAQPFLNFIFIVLVAPPYHVADLNFFTAAGLILFTAVAGYIGGWMAALLWNHFSPRLTNA